VRLSHRHSAADHKQSRKKGLFVRVSRGIVHELTDCDTKSLEEWGRDADQTTRPDRVEIPDFDKWISDNFDSRPDTTELTELKEGRALRAYQYMILECPSLRDKICSLRKQAGKLSAELRGAISVIFRVQINQELARKKLAVYAPAPQRCRIVRRSDQRQQQQAERRIRRAEGLYRHELQRLRDEVAEKHGMVNPSKLLDKFQRLDSLPLPSFAFHALKDCKAGSPQLILAAAREMRDTKEIKSVRKWLRAWERRYASVEESGKALRELQQQGKELSEHLSGKKHGIFASLRPGSWSIDPVWLTPTYNLPPLGEIVQPLWRRFNKQRLFLAAVSEELATDRELGSRILEQLGRYVY
jgi:hypothetical protein